MAAPDKTWTALLTRLADNNSGSITEEDVRSIARFAQTSYATASACATASPTGSTWVGTVPVDFETLDPEVTMPRYYKLLATDVSGTNSVYKHSGGDYMSVDNLAFTYAGGTGADAAAASRLIMFSWDTELYMESLEHCAIAWYYQPSGSTWPTNAKRHRIGRMYSRLGWLDPITTTDTFTNQFNVEGDHVGFSVTSTGTGSIVMNPGDKLVPLLEHYGPSGSLSVPMLNFDITAYTAGVVNSWTPPTQYWNNVSYAESEAPYAYPTIPRLLGPPTT